MPATTTTHLKRTYKRITGDGSRREAGEPEYYVLGGGSVGQSMAERLRALGHSVTVVDEDHVVGDLPGKQGDPEDLRVLQAAGVSDTSTVVVATDQDGRNLLIAQLVRAHFDVPEVLVLVNDPDRHGLVARAGHEPVCATTALADALVEKVDR